MIQKYITKYSLIYDVLKCPKDVIIPISDMDAWKHFKKHNWIYNKINICKTQDIICNPIGIAPQSYPIIIKPIINLFGMGWGSKKINNYDEYKKHISPGYFWMPFFEGKHLSYDFIIVNGEVKAHFCFRGYPAKDGMFDYWETLDNKPPNFILSWIDTHLNNDNKYTGCLNMEIIGDKIIECHLRMGDINQFHNHDVIKSIIEVYKGNEIQSNNLVNTSKVYLVPIFTDYNSKIELTYKELVDICNEIDPNSNYLYSCQLDPTQDNTFNPIGGVRVANINTSNLYIGNMVREKVLELLHYKKNIFYSKIIGYIVLILSIVIYFTKYC